MTSKVVSREMMLVRILIGDHGNWSKILSLIEGYPGRIITAGSSSVTAEFTGSSDKIEELAQLLPREFEVKETARTEPVSLLCPDSSEEIVDDSDRLYSEMDSA